MPSRPVKLVFAFVLAMLAAPAVADTILKGYIALARAALAQNKGQEAENDLLAASDYVREAAAKAATGSRERLQDSADELKTLAARAASANPPGTVALEEAADRADQALAAAGSNGAVQPVTFRGLFRDLGSDFKNLPSRDSLVVASIGGALALGAHPFDSRVNGNLANDGGFFKAGNIIGNTGTLVGASALTYVLGRATGNQRLAHVGLDLIRAQIVTEAMVETLKFTVRRERPNGGSGFAFPSGHSAMTFATATVIQRHHGWKWGLPLYGLATYVAMSRLHDNVHSLSDVVFGAAVGTIAGRTVTRHGKFNFSLVPIAVPGGKGLALVRNW